MAMFVTIGYGDETGYESTAAEVRDAAHAHALRGGAGRGRGLPLSNGS